MRKYRTHEEYLTEVLKNPVEAALYLNATVEENDPILLVSALAQVAKAHGMSKVAERAHLSRMGLYKTLSKKGNPQLKTFLQILKVAGIQLAFKPLAHAA